MSPTPSTNGATAPTSVKRACDACHRRKVKCDGLNPCRNCSSAQLTCTYNAIPQKKGPKGSRAKVISELRETQRQTTLSSKVANRMNGLQSPPCSPTLAPTPGLLTNEMIRECIDFFFANMYPTMPILHKQRLEQQARFADRDVDTYCLLTSLCAFMLIQPGMVIPGDPLGLDSMPGANLISGGLLLEETLRVRKSYDHLENPSSSSMVTSFFLFGCYFGLDLHNKAWFHLREATTLAHILGMNKEETYLQFDSIESSRRRRLYWLLFVTERAYALQRHRPLTLHATITLPSPQEDPSEPAAPLNGFIHLVALFRPFDDMFIALWNKARTDCSPSYLSALQKQLTDALPTYLNSTENQNVDLRTSQQWLRTMVWQLSMQNGCLSSTSDDPSMTFQYPVEISRDLIAMTSQFSQQSMEMHGVGLLEKLFDVACSLTDVLALLPTPSDPFVMGPRDYLTQFLTLLSTLRNGDNRFLPLLLQKIHEVLPRLTSPMLQVVPEAASQNCGMDPNIDIFDGFGNAGMGAPSSIPLHFDAKRMEDLSNERSVSSGTSSPFTSPIVSQGMEYPGMPEYGGYPGMPSPVSPQSSVHRQKSLNGQRPLPQTPPLRSNSQSSAYNMIPRSMPEYQPMMRENSGALEHFVSIGEGNMRRMHNAGMEQQQQHMQVNHGHGMSSIGLGVDGMDMSFR
ncbi:MAG: hypothetical protein M1818_003547 [Claussenomyces sp. TS43310]|nr:MAG: hypothetical protein M1818_003547 [Claussenomyces sp. TS43310]